MDSHPLSLCLTPQLQPTKCPKSSLLKMQLLKTFFLNEWEYAIILCQSYVPPLPTHWDTIKPYSQSPWSKPWKEFAEHFEVGKKPFNWFYFGNCVWGMIFSIILLIWGYKFLGSIPLTPPVQKSLCPSWPCYSVFLGDKQELKKKDLQNNCDTKKSP